MAVSVRMDPTLELQLDQAAKQRGITKSQFIIDAVERALGFKDPYKLLLQVQQDMQLELKAGQRAVRSAAKAAAAQTPATTGDRVRQVLLAKRQGGKMQQPGEPSVAKSRRRAAA
jgi:predicted DNA-binding protein